MTINIFKFTALLFVISILCSCASSRDFNVDYMTVSQAMKERFVKNEWTVSTTIKSIVKEKNDELYIRYYDWQFPDTKIRCDIDIEPQGETFSTVYVYVKNHGSWFYPFNYNWWLGEEVLDLLEKRLESGRWGRLSWEPPPRGIEN
jgi:hypothetical protein